MTDVEAKREYQRLWRLKNVEKERARLRLWRLNNPEKDKEAKRRWAENNPEKNKEAKRNWEKENPDKVKEKARRWSAANPEKNREKMRRWYHSHSEEDKARSKKYIQAHPEVKRMIDLRRRSSKANSFVNLTTAEQTEILRSGCLFCGSYEDLTIAHDTPVSKGGNTTRGNCFCLCRSCNSKMHTQSLAQRIKQLFLL